MHKVLEEVKNLLGAPVFEHGDTLLYCGDCLELMRQLPDRCVPLTITSPPYNIGKEYEVQRSVENYVAWSEKWVREVERLTTLRGAFWLNLGYFEVPEIGRAIPIPYLLWDKVPLYLLQEVVWNYGAGVACKKYFSPRNEKFLWYVKNPEEYTFNLDAVRDPNVKYPNQKKNGKLKCNPKGKNPTDVWQFPKVTSGANRSSRERTPHPAQFPFAVVERIVKACSNVGDVILDPFMGSGTVAEAALANGRAAIGFEINPDYGDIVAKRLRVTSQARREARETLFPLI